MTFAYRLKAWRKAVGMSRLQIAQLMGIAKRTIEDWESGINVPATHVQSSVLGKLKEMENLKRLNRGSDLATISESAFETEGRTFESAYSILEEEQCDNVDEKAIPDAVLDTVNLQHAMVCPSFPGYCVFEDRIFEIWTAREIPDICVAYLEIPGSLYRGLVRWGSKCDLLQDGNVMLRDLLLITKEDANKFSRNSWAKICEFVEDYLQQDFPSKKECENNQLKEENILPGQEKKETSTVESVSSILEEEQYDNADEKTIPDAVLETVNLQHAMECPSFPGYCVFEGRIFEIWTAREIPDICVTDLEIPNSLYSGLIRWGSKHDLLKNESLMLSDLLLITEEDANKFSRSSRAKICEFVEDYLQQDFPPKKECENNQLKVENKKSAIHAFFVMHPFATLLEENMEKQLSFDDPVGIDEALCDMVGSGILACEDGVVFKKYPSFYEMAKSLAKKERDIRRFEVVCLRAQDLTLDEIGQRMGGLTKERVRQMENGFFRFVNKQYDGYFEEDRFAKVFQKYNLEKDLLLFLTGNSLATVYYLNVRYLRGSSIVEDALSDEEISIKIRKQIESWLTRDCLHLNGELIPTDKTSIERYVFRQFFQDKGTIDEFFEKYNSFLSKQDLSQERMDKLIINEEQKRTVENKVAESKNVLCSLNRHVRYYDIDGTDFSTLFEILNLGQYQNIEISTLKFFRDFPSLMEYYDIRDEYELHNLLKKLSCKQENETISFSRMPTVRFGKFDRNQYVSDLLFKLAPISADDLAEYIFNELGFGVMSVRNWFGCIDEYFCQGKFSLDYIVMSKENMTILKEQLTDDFYFFDEVKKIYSEAVPCAYLAEISSYTMKQLGFDVNDSYIYRNYPSASDYFRHLFLDDDIVDGTKFHNRLKKVGMYLQIQSELEHAWEIIEYKPLQYINIRRLEQLGVGKEQLKKFCDEVYSFVESNTFFTVEYLKNKGFTSPLDALGFESAFYVSILKGDSRFSNWRLGRNSVFYTGKDTVSIAAFVLNYVSRVQSVNLDEFLKILAEEYHIALDKWKIIEQCNTTELYYDRIMNKIYVNYDAYCNALPFSQDFLS